MNTQKQHENSKFSIKSIKLARLDFEQKKNIDNMDIIETNLGLNSYFFKIPEKNSDIQLNLGMQLKLFENNDGNKANIGIIESEILGIFSCDGEINQKLLPNLTSILYSYLRPIVAQISIMAKLPPIDLPILNLSKIEVREIDNK